MSRFEDECDEVDVSRLLAGAAKVVASTRFCWLATATEAGVNARPMGRLPREPDDDKWTIRFIADGRSRKASEIRRVGRAAVIFQRDADDGYVTVIGAAKLCEDAAQDRQRWKDAYGVYFPGEQDRASAAFVEIDAERMELWIRGVTPEPFGLHPTVLVRGASGGWRLVRTGHKAAV